MAAKRKKPEKKIQRSERSRRKRDAGSDAAWPFRELPPTIDGRAKMDGTWIDATDKDYYNSAYYRQHGKTVQPFSPVRGDGIINLGSVLPPQAIERIKQSGQITFHTVGDTGSTLLTKLPNEEAVADMMAEDVSSTGASFLFHLGDVVYHFGEGNYYYEQFYNPFRDYNAPIFAIPGNHDGMIYDAKMKSLDAFYKNFCTLRPTPSPQAGGLIRSTMTQPGVYFRLDAPFVSLVGLYSNVIDNGPGVISSQNGKFRQVGDKQKQFLIGQLIRLKGERETDPRAVLVAVHHPPFSGDSKHGGSPLMSLDLDDAFSAAGLWPDAVLSGHAHHYERFERTVGTKKIPYLIAGSGGYNMLPIFNPPGAFPYPVPGRSDLSLENYLGVYGYLEITVKSSPREIIYNFNTPRGMNGAKVRAADSKSYAW